MVGVSRQREDPDDHPPSVVAVVPRRSRSQAATTKNTSRPWIDMINGDISLRIVEFQRTVVFFSFSLPLSPSRHVNLSRTLNILFFFVQICPYFTSHLLFDASTFGKTAGCPVYPPHGSLSKMCALCVTIENRWRCLNSVTSEGGHFAERHSLSRRIRV